MCLPGSSGRFENLYCSKSQQDTQLERKGYYKQMKRTCDENGGRS